MAKVLIVGSGVVGMATGRGLRQAGHDVAFVDVLPEKVRKLRSEGLNAGASVVLGELPAFVFLALPTPHQDRRYDLAALAQGVAAVGRAIAASPAMHTVVVRSTVPPAPKAWSGRSWKRSPASCRAAVSGWPTIPSSCARRPPTRTSVIRG